MLSRSASSRDAGTQRRRVLLPGRYDATGTLVGVTLLGARRLLDRDGAITITRHRHAAARRRHGTPAATRYAAEHLEHGYALTGHAAQGASVERAFVLMRAEGALAEGYRERHGVTDRQRALGPEPKERVAPGERRSVERAVEDVRAELSYLARAHERSDTGRPGVAYERGPRHDLGRGIERGLDHGPSLGMGR